MDMPESISLAIIVSFIILDTILVDNKLMGIIKTIVFIMVIIVCLTMIGLVFYRMDAREILDNYRRSRLAGGTSIYLNILYYDGKTVDIGSAISMTGVGLGCIAMPLMYKGVLNIRDNKELDVGRIWAVIFEGFTILSSCILALLVVPVLYPEKAWANMNSFQVYNLMLKKLLGTGTYAYVFRFAALMVFIAAVVVMLESFMRNICEHIRGLVPAISRAGGIAKLLIDIGVVVLTGCCVFLVAEFVEFNREHMIAENWGLCAAALAAPLFCTLTYRHATGKGMYAGIIAGILTFVMWKYLPFVNGGSLAAYSGISGDVVGFAVSLLFTIGVSVCTQKNTEEELKIFDRMRADQA